MCWAMTRAVGQAAQLLSPRVVSQDEDNIGAVRGGVGLLPSWWHAGCCAVQQYAELQAPATARHDTMSRADEVRYAAMVDPADRTYPTTVTSTLSTTRTGPSGATTIDHVTMIDPWPTSPDPEVVPFTNTETAVTERIVITKAAEGPATATTTMTATSTWILWPVRILDMPPYIPPQCPGPSGCAYRSVKPHPRCERSGRETRCAAQCLLKDWLWWCSNNVTDPDATRYYGRVCADGNVTDTAYDLLLEPCDHTDFKPGCPLCLNEDGENEGYDY